MIALGGNSIAPKGGVNDIQEQFLRTREAIKGLSHFISKGYNLCLNHGNGPQVGNELMRMELSKDVVPPLPLGVCVASTQGSIGYMIQQSLQNKLRKMKIDRNIYNGMLNFFKRVKNNKFRTLKLPKFNKAIDDRCKKKLWYSIKKKPDVIIFEGWCVGAKAEKNNTLKKTINSLERKCDKKMIWRKYVNQQLKSKYKKLFNQLSCLLFLKANNFSLLQRWRLKQEKKLWLKNKKSSNNKIMNKKAIINFMQTYQRITENMIKNAPKYASIILNLNSNHQIKSLEYKKK